MIASLGIRALAAGALIVSLGVGYRISAGAASADRAMTINVQGGAPDRVLPFTNHAPKGFTAVTFNDRRWALASPSACVDPTWAVPQGAGPWLWAASCTARTAAIAVRRGFIVPAGSVLTGRLSLAIHGSGSVYVNGHMVAQSTGNPVLVDVTAYLKTNGAKNVLAMVAGAAAGDTGLGIAYNLRLVISQNAFKAFARTHHGRLLPPSPAFTGGGTVAPPTAVPGASGKGVCATNPPPGVVQVFTPPNSTLPAATGWVRKITTQDVYVVTRSIDLTKIGAPSDMPGAKIAGNNERANAIISSDATGIQVLDLPFNSNIGPLATGNPHNQPAGQGVVVTAYSTAQNCMATYTATVRKYLAGSAEGTVAQIDTVPFQDAADGGVAFDGAGNLLGIVIFDPAVLDAQNNVAPLILPTTTAFPTIDHLIAVLAKTQVATTGEHIVSVTTAADGTQTITHIDGTAAPATTATAAPTGTAAPPTATPGTH